MDGGLPENPRTPSRRMSLDVAVRIWVLHFEGHLNSRIAAVLDINQGRVSEVLNGKRFPEARGIAQRSLID